MPDAKVDRAQRFKPRRVHVFAMKSDKQVDERITLLQFHLDELTTSTTLAGPIGNDMSAK